MNILIVIESAKGGAYKSISNIIEGLKEIDGIKIKMIIQKIKSKLLSSLTLDSYLSIPKILIDIIKFKPDIIITQNKIAFPTIILSYFKKIPVINIIRSTVDFCPKYVDIINYGKDCSGIDNRKKCFDCINKWRTLRILIGNRKKGSEYSIKTSIMNVLYKLRYFICSFNLFLIKKANINIIASNLMKNYFHKINKNKFKIMNITPIYKPKIEVFYKKKQLLFVRTNYETSHKGLDFIKKLSKYIPDYKIIIVGGDDNLDTEVDGLINIGYVSSEIMFNKLLADSIITLIPTFCTEAFGRVIIESLVNKTPIISSQQCGANQFFENKEFVKVLPIKLDLWINAINEMILNSPIIDDNDVSQIYEKFSIEKSRKDFIRLIKKVLKS